MCNFHSVNTEVNRTSPSAMPYTTSNCLEKVPQPMVISVIIGIPKYPKIDLYQV